MRKIFDTIEKANQFIDRANELLHFPDPKSGTETYSIPEPILNEAGEITGYDVQITDEPNNLINGENTTDTAG